MTSRTWWLTRVRTTALGLLGAMLIIGIVGLVDAQDDAPPNQEQAPPSGEATEDATPSAGQEQGDGFDSDLERYSYALGADIAGSLSSQGLKLDPKLVAAGMRDALDENATPRMTEAQRVQVLTNLQRQLAMAQMQKMQEEAATNLDVANAWLKANAEKQGVKTTESGLQYKIIKEGTGDRPAATDTVVVHYEGKLTDGTVFDASRLHDPPEAVRFPVNGVISGWTEALQLMKEGAKWQLYIPPDLAYGERGRPPRIAPNSALVFEVELLEVIPADQDS